MTGNQQAFVVLYRWKLREGMEADFARAWEKVTRHFLENCGSMGSRLHRGNDGLYYGYAMWPSSEAREKAFSGAALEEAFSEMKEAAVERLPEVEMEIVADLIGA